MDKNKAGNSEVDRLRAARLCNRPAQRVRFVGDRFLRHGGCSAIKMFFDVRREILLPSAAVGVLFMIAAFRNYAVQQPIGFLRSLILVGVCLILGVAIASSLNMTLSLDDKFNVSTPLDWFTLVAGLTPVSVYFAVVLRKELAAQERNLPVSYTHLRAHETLR